MQGLRFIIILLVLVTLPACREQADQQAAGEPKLVTAEQQADTAELAVPRPYNFSLAPAGGGDEHSFAKLTAESQLVVYTWETDCPLCAMQLPYVNDLAEGFDPAQARLVGISVGNSEEETFAFTTDHGLSFTTLWAFSGEVDKVYFEPGVPTTFVFAKGGELIGVVSDLDGLEYLEAVRSLVVQQP